MEGSLRRQLMDEEGMVYHVSDKKGNVSRYRLFNGHKFAVHYFPANGSEFLEALSKIQCRDDDVVLCTFPKSGTHWLKNIVSMLVRGNQNYVETGPVFGSFPLTKLDEMESPRIIVTHHSVDCLPEGYKNGKGKVISITRNPKDVALSLYFYNEKLSENATHYRGDMDGFLNFFLTNEIICDGWFHHVKMWPSALRKYPNLKVMFLGYEDMKTDLYKEISKISEFLQLDSSEAFLKKVNSLCTFGSMQRYAKKCSTWNDWYTYNDGMTPERIYRKGEVGDWKNYFTVAQSERFDAVYKQEMKGHDVSLVFKEQHY